MVWILHEKPLRSLPVKYDSFWFKQLEGMSQSYGVTIEPQ
jgi:hypothetical protein